MNHYWHLSNNTAIPNEEAPVSLNLNRERYLFLEVTEEIIKHVCLNHFKPNIKYHKALKALGVYRAMTERNIVCFGVADAGILDMAERELSCGTGAGDLTRNSYDIRRLARSWCREEYRQVGCLLQGLWLVKKARPAGGEAIVAWRRSIATAIVDCHKAFVYSRLCAGRYIRSSEVTFGDGVYSYERLKTENVVWDLSERQARLGHVKASILPSSSDPATALGMYVVEVFSPDWQRQSGQQRTPAFAFLVASAMACFDDDRALLHATIMAVIMADPTYEYGLNYSAESVYPATVKLVRLNRDDRRLLTRESLQRSQQRVGWNLGDFPAIGKFSTAEVQALKAFKASKEDRSAPVGYKKKEWTQEEDSAHNVAQLAVASQLRLLPAGSGGGWSSRSLRVPVQRCHQSAVPDSAKVGGRRARRAYQAHRRWSHSSCQAAVYLVRDALPRLVRLFLGFLDS
jgi:hypothetical protein